MKVPSTIATLLSGIALTLISIWYGQNNGLLPIDASAEATQIDHLFNAMLAISTGLFLLVQGALIYSLIAFRRRRGDNTDAEPVHGNVPLEILWTAIPTVIVLWLAVYSFDIYKAVDSGGYVAPTHLAHSHHHAGSAIAATLPDAVEVRPDSVGAEPKAGQDPATATVRNQELPQREEAPLSGVVSPQIGPTSTEKGKLPDFQVNVTGLQFAWIFTYPDTGVVSGELHLPANREVRLNISANDVIHAFWVPEFRLKQDAIPGRETHMRFMPTLVGEYPVVCAELCGAYHAAMKTKVIVQTPADFEQWVNSQRVAALSDHQAVATRPAETPDEFLAPHLASMGLQSQLAIASDVDAVTQTAADPHQMHQLREHLASHADSSVL